MCGGVHMRDPKRIDGLIAGKREIRQASSHSTTKAEAPRLPLVLHHAQVGEEERPAGMWVSRPGELVKLQKL